MRTAAKIVLVGAALLVAGCAGVSETSAPRPALTPPPVPPLPPVSSIAATITLPLGDLQRLINEKAPQRFADISNQKIKCGFGECVTTLTAARTGPIAVTSRGGALAVDVPFVVDADLALPAPLSAMHTAIHASGVVHGSTALTFGPDWQVRPNTSGSVAFDNGRVHLGPLNTDFTTLWNLNPEFLSRPLLGALDRQVGVAVAVKEPMAHLWAGVFAPIRLKTKPTTWLVLQPERLRVGLPAVRGDTLTMGLGIDARARLVASDEEPRVAPTPLPPPATVNGPSNHFAVNVPVVLTYEEAARLGLDALQKKPPRAGSHLITVSKLEIIPSGQDVVIFTSFCIAERWDPTEALTGCGSGYLRGAPQFDAETQTIRIVNVRYDVLTEDWMLRMMRGLSGSDFGKGLEKALQFKVADQIKKVQADVGAALAKPQGGAVTISGEVERFGAPTLTWSKDGFVTLFSAEGSVKAEIKL